MSKKPKHKNDSGEIPDQVINQIIEHTIGGFIIFYFNNKTGQPEPIMTFDTPAHCLALQKYIADWSEAMHSVNLNQSIENMEETLRGIKDDDDDEEKE
jgi:hypothetical protein